MELVLLVASWLFIITHIDTFAVLLAFCVDNRFRAWEIVVGYYLGSIVALIAGLLALFIAIEHFPNRIYLLGVIPIVIGLVGVANTSKRESNSIPTVDRTLSGPSVRVGTVLLTAIGLSGENLAVFIPFFVTLSTVELVAVIGLYLIGLGVVYGLSAAIARLTVDRVVPLWVDRWVVPIVLIVVGSYVVIVGWL